MSEHVTLAKIVPFAQIQTMEIPEDFIKAIGRQESEKFGLIVASISTQHLIRIIPCHSDHVYKIKVELMEIAPDMVKQIGGLFAQYGIKALYSTGLCIQKENCTYEVYADPEALTKDFEQLKADLVSLDAIIDVQYDKITFD